MNVAARLRQLRNAPRPELAAATPDCGLSQRREVIAALCNKVNEILEYAHFGSDIKVPVPAQSNIDARMPMTFLRPCISALNDVASDHELAPMPQIGDNIDYHGFILWVNRIVAHANRIIEAL
jgi:hypothetical protein